MTPYYSPYVPKRRRNRSITKLLFIAWAIIAALGGLLAYVLTLVVG